MSQQPSERPPAAPIPRIAWYGTVPDDEDTPYEVEVSAVGCAAVLAVRGEIDLRTAPRLWDDLDRVIGDGALDVVLDLGQLEFIDSSGLSVLVRAMKLLRERQGDLTLRSVTDRTYRILEVAGLTRVLSVHPA